LIGGTVLDGILVAVTPVEVLDFHVTVVKITVLDQTFLDVFSVAGARAHDVRVSVVIAGPTTAARAVYNRRGVSTHVIGGGAVGVATTVSAVDVRTVRNRCGVDGDGLAGTFGTRPGSF